LPPPRHNSERSNRRRNPFPNLEHQDSLSQSFFKQTQCLLRYPATRKTSEIYPFSQNFSSMARIATREWLSNTYLNRFPCIFVKRKTPLFTRHPARHRQITYSQATDLHFHTFYYASMRVHSRFMQVVVSLKYVLHRSPRQDSNL
ncbi:hypothetical protein ACRQDN_08060, partial [Actinotignum sp. GS-2025e]|uniref:hypothetical protein n=1 Tax=Actinotignum sp. GS-2025e TaxID=3427278 RepID=UPI003F47AE61